MELLKRVDQAVERFVGTKDYQEVFRKWFGEPPRFWTTARVVFVLAGVVLISLLVMAGWRHYSLVSVNRELSSSMAARRQAEETLRTILDNTNDGYSPRTPKPDSS